MIDGTPLLRLWSRRRLARLAALDPAGTQQDQLAGLVRMARDTAFGRAHDFASVRTVEDFQRAVPLRDYDTFRDRIWKDAFPDLTNFGWPGPVSWFAETSGTTRDVTKYIPVTKAMLQSNRRAVLDMYAHHLAARPGSRVLGGLSFMLGGSTVLRTLAPGIRAGDLSGIATATTPFWARSRMFPPAKLALLADWEEKIARLAEESVHRDVRSVAGTPSWLLLLFEHLAALRPDCDGDLTRIWPRLDLLVHGGVRFDSYKSRFDRWLRGRDVDYREAYAASEGFIASSDRNFGEGLRLNIDHGLFFEFVPVGELGQTSPTRHWAGTAETGVDYAIALSTCAGLWGWLVGDTVRFVDLDPPRLLVTGRTSYMMSAFGEHLSGEEIDRAVRVAADDQKLVVAEYSVGAVFPDEHESRGQHCFVVEFDNRSDVEVNAHRFSDAVDADLAAGNEDYAAHRSGGFGLRAPRIIVVSSGFFADWMKRRGKLGGQNKVPRVINDRALFDGLVAFAAARADRQGGN